MNTVALCKIDRILNLDIRFPFLSTYFSPNKSSGDMTRLNKAPIKPCNQNSKAKSSSFDFGGLLFIYSIINLEIRVEI